MSDRDASTTPLTLDRLAVPRALTAVERAWLDHLVGPLARSELTAQAAAAEVVSECACGCPSIGLGGAGPDLPPDATERLSETGRDDYLSRSAHAANAQGHDVEITLHVGDGRLIELEVWVGSPAGVVNTELPPAP